MKSFSFHEKCVVYLFICFLSVLVKFALRAPEERWPHVSTNKKFTKEQIVVWVIGEVENKGRYHFDKGTTLKEALAEIKLKRGATLDGLALEKPLKEGQKIKIKKSNKSLVNN